MPTHFGRPIHTFLFFVAAASWIRVTGGEGQKLKLASGRTVFHIVGMIPYPGSVCFMPFRRSDVAGIDLAYHDQAKTSSEDTLQL